MSAARPNILLFFTDDQRFDTLGALGNPHIHTPNLDALVARGTAFTRAHIPGGTCGAVCMPSRAMLHTGRTLFHLHGRGETIPDDHRLLGEHLREAGYEAFGTGKWHNAPSSYARSFSTGDEIFFGGMADHWNVPACHFDPTGRYDHPVSMCQDALVTNKTRQGICDHITPGVHSTDLLTDAAVHFLENRLPGQPFFLYQALLAPHDPRTMPERFRSMYRPEDIPLPENFRPWHDIDTGSLRNRDERLAPWPREPDDIRRHIAEYYAMISHLDDAFGRVVDALERAGELDQTLIVFAGDNGLALGRHGLMGKQNLYDHSVRVPLVFAGPGIPRGEQRDQLVYLLDLFPTLCDHLGLETPASCEGRSFADAIRQGDATGREDLFLAYVSSIRGVTDGFWKLIEYACGATQLFDLDHDPHETRSLALDPRHDATRKRLRRRLAELAHEWDDMSHPLGDEFWSQRRDWKRW